MSSSCSREESHKLHTMASYTTENETNNSQTKCGWFSCRPNCLNYCNTSRWFLTWVCSWSIVGGMAINGLTNVSITSLERRFELSSSKSALLPSIYDIPSSVLSVLVGYFGAHGSKPRWIAIGAVFQGLGCLVFSLPHFLTDDYLPETTATQTGLCGEHNATSSCNDKERGGESISSLASYLYVFLLGQVLLGIGSSPGVLATAFIDENVKEKNVGLYLGIKTMFHTLGPALGYIAGGLILNLVFTDFSAIDTASFDIDPSSHQWVGAWWLGFLVCGVLTLISAIPLSCFPPQLPGAKNYLSERRQQRHAVEGIEKTLEPGFGKGVRDLPYATKMLIKNPTFMLLTGVVVSEAVFLTGAEVFLPKLLEEQFGLSAGNASLAVGIDATVFGCTALLFSGWLVKRFQLSIPSMLKMSLCSSIVCGFFLLSIFLRCEDRLLAGVNVPYLKNSTQAEFPSLEASCNSECHCSTADYTPVCGSQGIMYFSPCHAACSSYNLKTLEYENCSCIDTDNTSNEFAVEGVCGDTCASFYVFMAFVSAIIFTFSFCETPLLIILLRCVPQNLRAYAMGLESFAGRLLGALPGPIILGLLIDNACILWHEECEEKGQCWFHDRATVSRNIVLFAITMKIIVIACYFATLKCYKPVGEETKYDPVPMAKC